MWIRVVSAAVFVWVAGCQCRPDPAVPDSDEPDTDEPEDTDEPLDTAPPPQCAWPEIEPNQPPNDPVELPLEVEACGLFDQPFDTDFWTFGVEADVWLGVRLDAFENGSLANPSVLLTSDSGVVLERVDDTNSADVSLLFPSPPDTYFLTVIEQNQQGSDDERYFYDLIATVQKSPREWTDIEIEPNDAREEAQSVQSGDSVFGVLSDPDDDDYYRIDVPAGRHTLTVAVDAYEMGSPADLELFLQRPDGSSPGCGAGNNNCNFRRGEVGFERDPWMQFTSEGDETLYVRAKAEDDRGTTVHWYVMDVILEEP